MIGIEKQPLWIVAAGISGLGCLYALYKHGFRRHHSFTVVSMGAVSLMSAYKATLPEPAQNSQIQKK